MEQRDSTDLYDVDEQGWDKEKQQRQIWAEEIKELMLKYAPSRSVEDQQKKSDMMERFFNTRSWTKIENLRSEELIERFNSMRNELEQPQEKEHAGA